MPRSRAEQAALRQGTRASKPHEQHRREHPQHGADGAAKNTANRVKTRLRSVRRLLENRNDSMALDQRIALEREQATLQQDLQVSLERARRRKLISKYHMVRFFERRKAERAFKRARKSAEETGESTGVHGSSTEEIHRREVDLNYTMYFPLSEAYVSLYPKDKSSGPNRSCPVWGEVESAMTRGTLQDLRDRPGTTTSMLYTSRRQAERSGARFGTRQVDPNKLECDSGQQPRIEKTPKARNVNTQEESDGDLDGGSDDDGAGFFE